MSDDCCRIKDSRKVFKVGYFGTSEAVNWCDVFML